MARYFYDAKTVAEDCRDLCIYWLREHDYFKYGYKYGGITWRTRFGGENSITIISHSGETPPFIELSYTINKEKEYKYKIALASTKCNYGNKRYWFICPLVIGGRICGRRVAKLYQAPGYEYFGCRHCYNLSYESRNESKSIRGVSMFGIIKADSLFEKYIPQIGFKYRKGKPTKKYLILIRKLLRVYPPYAKLYAENRL